jgi:hypothetical protein
MQHATKTKHNSIERQVTYLNTHLHTSLLGSIDSETKRMHEHIWFMCDGRGCQKPAQLSYQMLIYGLCDMTRYAILHSALCDALCTLHQDLQLLKHEWHKQQFQVKRLQRKFFWHQTYTCQSIHCSRHKTEKMKFAVKPT